MLKPPRITVLLNGCPILCELNLNHDPLKLSAKEQGGKVRLPCLWFILRNWTTFELLPLAKFFCVWVGLEQTYFACRLYECRINVHILNELN